MLHFTNCSRAMVVGGDIGELGRSKHNKHNSHMLWDWEEY